DVIKESGADILRLWVSSADYKSDIRISKNILKQLSEGYRKIRNTARYMIGNLSDFDPNTDKINYDNMNELDKWAMLKLQKLISGVTNAYENYNFHVVYHDIHNFCVVDMSNFYLDIVKDRLYTEKTDSSERRAAQTVMYEILNALVRMIAPVMSFTAEEIWSFVKKEDGESAESVLLAEWPQVSDDSSDKDLEDKWDKMREIRTEVSKALEIARREKVIGNSLNAKVYINAEGEVYDFLENMREYLETIFIVSQLELTKGVKLESDSVYTSEEMKDLSVLVQQAPGEKCERCWIFSSTIGEDKDHLTLCTRCSTVVK
ncbi:MAG: class I tRNA ligase family protein, partial [Clostridium sp.]